MTDEITPSEFGGKGTNRNTITRGARLTNSDRLRLRYRTGQTVDRDAPADSASVWEGVQPAT